MQDKSPLRWGILGTGGIARAFVADLGRLDDHKVVAVGSRTYGKAESFAAASTGRRTVPRAHGSYEALVADPEVDVVYVATPHPFHRPHALLALGSGKHALVEKPFAMDAAEAAEMVALARSKGLFLMEAMWTRFLPHMAAIRRILEAGTLGPIVTVSADHGQWFARDPGHRLFDKGLGGGALLDLGIYPVSFASLVLGTPVSVLAASDLDATGADAQTSMIFGYASGAHALLTTTLRAVSATVSSIVGEEARIDIDRKFYAPTMFRVTNRNGSLIERFDSHYDGRGLREEAAEVARCLRAGLAESPLMRLEETVSIMETMDRVRGQIGLEYRGAAR